MTTELCYKITQAISPQLTIAIEFNAPDCNCRIFESNGSSYHVEYCPTHLAALDLLSLCTKTVRRHIREAKLAQFDFTQAEKKGMLRVLDKITNPPNILREIRESIRLDGSTILSAEEASYLVPLIRPYYSFLADRLEGHPVIVTAALADDRQEPGG